MSNSDQLVDRAIEDPEFRQRLLADPEGVVTAEGYDLSSDAVALIKRLCTMPPEAVEEAIRASAPETGTQARA